MADIAGAVKLQHQEQDGVRLDAKTLKMARDCRRKVGFSALSLNYDGAEVRSFVRRAANYMLELQMNGEVDWERCVIEFFKDYRQDWFDSVVEYSTSLSRDQKMVLRMGRYIAENGYKPLKTAYPYSVKFSPVDICGMELSGFSGKIDVLLEKEGKITAVLLFSGEPKYSSRAKKSERRPENSIELLTMYLALYQRIPGIQVELWYLKNKDDGGELIDKFEHRPGKNIVRGVFTGAAGDIFKRLLALLNEEESRDCENCIHRKICQVEEFRADEVSETVENSQPAKVVYTKQQQRVIDHINGPMCVVAVPGAGKTKSLVARMVNLIRIGVAPRNILFVTFTKKACSEIEERVKVELAKLGIRKEPSIMTFNSLGYSILRENPLYAGGKRLKLADDGDRYRLIYEAVVSCPAIKGVSYVGLKGEHGLVRQLDKLFAELDESEEKNPGKSEEIFRQIYAERKDVDGILTCYHKYKEKYNEAGFISYDDQVNLVLDMFEEYPVLKRKYAERFQYIMVDEFQDTCREQAEMIYGIAKQHNNFVVVGDDDQSIYRWRGGTSEFMLHFQDDFPTAETVYMSDNFRSDSGILSAADCLIQGNGMRYEKHIVSHGDKGYAPAYIKGEPQYLATVVNKILAAGGKPGKICVLARNNKRLEQAKEILDNISVPVNLAKDYLVKDAVFLAIYDVLALYYGGLKQDVPFYRLMRRCNLSVKKPERKLSLYENLLAEGKLCLIDMEQPESLKAYAQETLSAEMMFGSKLLSCFGIIKGGNIRKVLERILFEFFHVSSHRVVEALCDMAEEKGIIKCSKLYAMMRDMVVFDTKNRAGYEVSKDAVNLLTSHDSKGKEFDTVIIYGVEDYEDSEEEVRVLYVSMTRAQKNLYLLETSMPENTAIFDKLSDYVTVIDGCRQH